MKNLLALVAIVLSVLVIYTVHQDRVRKAAAEADALARSEAFKWKRPPQSDRPSAVGISRLIEPTLLELFGPLDEEFPADLVPPLQIVKERILDKRQHAIAAKQSVYDQAIRTLDLMIAAAEERTGVLDAVLRINARPASPLDAPNTGTNSKTFFLQTTVKRWDAAKGQRSSARRSASGTSLSGKKRRWKPTVSLRCLRFT
jgi:hypothetical protein